MRVEVKNAKHGTVLIGLRDGVAVILRGPAQVRLAPIGALTPADGEAYLRALADGDDASLLLPLGSYALPKPVSKMSGSEIATWSNSVVASMAREHERLTGEKLPVASVEGRS